MKHWIITLSLALMLAASFATTNAFAAEQHHVKIIGYAPSAYSVTDDDWIASQLSRIERDIMFALSENKGDVILTIDVYGNADETGSARDNQDYGTRRALEVQNALASKFQSLSNATVHVYEHTNGTKKNERSTDVLWTIAPAPVPASPREDRGRNIVIVALVSFVSIAAIAITALVVRPRKDNAAGITKPTNEIIEFEWNGKTYTTIALWEEDKKWHTKIPLPTNPNAFVIRDNSRDLGYAIRSLAKKQSYQPTIERLLADKVVTAKEVS